MKEITIPVLWAATEYYLGALLWVAIAGVLLGLILWAIALVSRSGVGRAIKPAIILGVLAGIGVSVSIPALTRSSWSYVAGGTDYVAIIGVGIAAAVAVAYMLTPVIMLVKPRA